MRREKRGRNTGPNTVLFKYCNASFFCICELALQRNDYDNAQEPMTN